MSNNLINLSNLYRKDIRDFFKEHYYICFVAFVIAVIVFVLFLFIEKLRFTKILNFFVAFVIVSSYCALLTLYPTVSRGCRVLASHRFITLLPRLNCK